MLFSNIIKTINMQAFFVNYTIISMNNKASSHSLGDILSEIIL